MSTPTAEEFWKESSPDEKFGMLAELKKHHLDKHVFEAMKRFAKLHVEAALEAAAAKAVEIQKPTARKYVSKKELIGSYPLTNIK